VQTTVAKLFTASTVTYANITYTSLLTGGPTPVSYSDTGTLATFSSQINSYNQIILQNTSSGASASTNYNVSNDQGSATANFGEFGINSSTFSGAGAFNKAGATYFASASTDLAIGTYGASTLHLLTNSSATDAAQVSAANVFIAAPVAPVAGGSATAYLGISSTASLGLYFGSGVPTIAAAQGSLYMRTDGSSTSTRMYVNTNGSTGWTNLVTAT
jgi:hypothetical protein